MSAAYVLDTNSFRVFGNCYPESFPSFWDRIEKPVAEGCLCRAGRSPRSWSFRAPRST